MATAAHAGLPVRHCGHRTEAGLVWGAADLPGSPALHRLGERRPGAFQRGQRRGSHGHLRAPPSSGPALSRPSPGAPPSPRPTSCVTTTRAECKAQQILWPCVSAGTVHVRSDGGVAGIPIATTAPLPTGRSGGRARQGRPAGRPASGQLPRASAATGGAMRAGGDCAGSAVLHGMCCFALHAGWRRARFGPLAGPATPPTPLLPCRTAVGEGRARGE